MDLTLNNLQRLICHKTQQTKPNLDFCFQDLFKIETPSVKISDAIFQIQRTAFAFFSTFYSVLFTGLTKEIQISKAEYLKLALKTFSFLLNNKMID